MAKIIRLTESDLNRIVRRVIMEKEGDWEKLPKPLSIKMEGTHLYDLTEIRKTPLGCQYRGIPRGMRDIDDDFMYYCDGKLKRGTVTDADEITISEQARELLRISCNCDKYVKTNTRPSTTV